MYRPVVIALMVLPLVVFGAAWSAAAQPCSWELRSDEPGAQSGHSMASDPSTGGLVMFHTGSTGGMETWRRELGSWVPATGTGPSRRYRAAMAADTLRGRAILFGGNVGPGAVFSSETWSWDGSAWALLNPPLSPHPRANHAMVYDAARDRIVLFGGWSGSWNGSTWEFDGATWAQVSVTGPAPREAHAMAYDAARQRVVLFGGLTGVVACSSQTWEWDWVSWVLRTGAGPSARGGAALAYDPVREVMVLFGGASCQGTYHGDTWEWDGKAWTLRATTGPSARYFHAMAYDANVGRIVLHGGDSPQGSLRDDTWEWDGAVWSPAGGPGDRAYHAMTYDQSRGRTVVFGGSFSPAVHEWDGARWHAAAPAGAAPDPRGRYTMTYDGARSLLIGARSNFPMETWAWNGAAWTRLAQELPVLGRQQAAAYDRSRRRAVLVNGRSVANEVVSETWEFDGAHWLLRDTGGVPLNLGLWLAMAYDPVRGVSVLHTSYGSIGSTWEWDGEAWERRGDPGPLTTAYSRVLVYDEARARMLLVESGGAQSATWAWDGTAWRELEVGAFTERYSFGAVYDSQRRAVVLFGGEAPCEQPLCPVLSDLWELESVNSDCPADWDCSGAITSGDFFEFLGSFFSGGDFNADGRSDSQDFFDFITAFFGGCV